MKTRFARISSLVGVIAVACIGLASVALAQDIKLQPKGKYVVLPARLRYDVKVPPASLQTWNGSFNYQGTNYTYNMVGTAPSTNASTTVQVYVIPLKVVITPRRGSSTTYDPSHVLSNGKTVTTNTTTSPIFNSSTTYVQGGVNVGTTQYIDAYQRANFWGTVQSNTNYHLLLGGPTVLAEQTLSPPSAYGPLDLPSDS